ncbi:hypothetical protein [Kitasatospora sp. HPMI-4]|uniref:hypothetical protein n=1 Tax=Kitasatospora sp. HPMI-4 TaxID=3448443 RepID=UPI003F19ADF0
MSGEERRPSKWDAVAEDVIADYRAGRRWVAISRAHGIPVGSIATLLARYGVARDRKEWPKLSADVVIPMYVRERLSQRKIAAALGASENAVREVLDQHRVETRPSGPPGGALREAGDER